jgi:hypothetical protein
MERLRGGAALTDLDAVRAVTGGAAPERVLINALNVWFASVVGCETFHADVHAGERRRLSLCVCLPLAVFVSGCLSRALSRSLALCLCLFLPAPGSFSASLSASLSLSLAYAIPPGRHGTHHLHPHLPDLPAHPPL